MNLVRELTKRNGMMLEVRNKESQLIAETQEGMHTSLVSRHWKFR